MHCLSPYRDYKLPEDWFTDKYLLEGGRGGKGKGGRGRGEEEGRVVGEERREEERKLEREEGRKKEEGEREPRYLQHEWNCSVILTSVETNFEPWSSCWWYPAWGPLPALHTPPQLRHLWWLLPHISGLVTKGLFLVAESLLVGHAWEFIPIPRAGMAFG